MFSIGKFTCVLGKLLCVLVHETGFVFFLLGYHRKIFKSGEAIKAITAFYLQVKPQGQSSLFICSAVTHDVIDIQFVT